MKEKNMKERIKKTEFRYFTIAEWKKEQDYLQEQHRKGWKFTGVSFLGFYHFEKCEPEEMIYQLDYNPEGTANKDEYIQMFEDCGWEYLLDFVGYSYFRKPVSKMNGVEEIFCDDASRIEMMKRVFKGRVVPLLILFFGLIIPQMIVQGHSERKISHMIAGSYMILFVIYLLLFLNLGYQFWTYWKMLRK